MHGSVNETYYTLTGFSHTLDSLFQNEQSLKMSNIDFVHSLYHHFCSGKPDFPMHGHTPHFFKIKLENWSHAQFTYCVESQVAPHVARCHPIQNSGTSQSPQTLSTDVEESTEQGHLGTDQIGEGDSRVDMATTDVTDGLDERSSCQPKAEGHMKHIVSATGPAQRRTKPKEDEEHCAIELGKNCPPERHGSELPHGCSRG